MKSTIEAVKRLQSLDERAAALDREIATLPRHVAEIEKKLGSHIQLLDRNRVALADNGKLRKKLEDDIKVQEQKISKLRDQMLQAKTNEQYRAFQHEIEYCEAEIRKIEDRILGLWEASDPLEKDVKAAEQSLAEEKKSVEAEKKQAEQQTLKSREALEATKKERADVAASLDPQVLARYEHIRKRYHGIAVADATEGRCTVCHMSLRPQFYQDLKRGEKLMLCESCGRILYYDPPVNLEHEMHQQV